MIPPFAVVFRTDGGTAENSSVLETAEHGFHVDDLDRRDQAATADVVAGDRADVALGVTSARVRRSSDMTDGDGGM